MFLFEREDLVLLRHFDIKVWKNVLFADIICHKIKV